jgi:ATP-binding cassette subfamily B protein
MKNVVAKQEPLINFLASIEILSTFSSAELARLAEHAELKTYDFGETVFSIGELAEGLYVIQSGIVRIFTEYQGKETSIGVRKPGEVLAEVAALRGHRHEYSARASARTELLFIARHAIAPLLAQNKDAEAFMARSAAISTAGGFFSLLFNLKGKINKVELEDFIRSVGIKRVKAGQTILKQDSREDQRLYVVHRGLVRITRQEDGIEYPLAVLGQGEIFGEKACLLRQEQIVTAVADTDTVLLIIPEKTVHFIFERNPNLKGVLEERIQATERELQRQKKLAERRTASQVLLDLRSKPGLGERVVKRFPLVYQAEEMDCGAACLAMISKYYGIPITLGKLREMANVTQEGATFASLAQVGESLGFTTRGLQCTYQALLGFDLPFIAHWEGYHFIVVYGVSKHHVWVADPGPGFKKMTVAEFEKGWTGTCLLFIPGVQLAQLAASQSPWVRFIGYLKPYKSILTHLFIASLVINLLGLAPPIITQNILDRVIVHNNFSLLSLLIIGLVITSVFTQLTTMMRSFLANFMVRNLDFAMMSQFCKHTFSLPISFFATRKTGDIIARFQENQTIRNFLTTSTVSTILNVLMIFLYFTVLFAYNVRMTLLLIVLVIPLILLTVLVTPKLKDYARRTFTATTDSKSILMETIGGAETVKAMGIERLMRLKWEKKYANALEVQYQAERFHIFVGLASQLLNMMASIVILWIGASSVMNQELTIGQLIAFNALMGSVMSPLMGLVGLWNQINDTGIAMERLGDVLDLQPEQKPEEMASRIILPELHGNIRFDNAYFRYGGRETPYVLENISFEADAGQTVAIVGPSGSGKSTLAKLLVGFYPPSDGQIYVDGYDLNLIDKQYYRAQIGYVMQSNLLFSGTLAENIAAGDENPDRQRIIEVAKMADAHGFISNMPLGYEQVVGERGMGLSGGQMQRLCIARALYHGPRLLIFDEATSALDTESESNILKNMGEILKGRTAFIIAHRLSTIMHADKILVLYEGHLVEQGQHQELLAKKGMYHHLIQKQMAREG